MLDSLTHFISLFGSWGYLVVFGIVALECQAILGLFIPGESLVLVAGFLAQQGIFDLGDLIFVIAAAAILGDSIGYKLGRHLGLKWLIQSGRRFGLRQESLNRVDQFFTRHGGKAVFASHFMHMMRALMPFIAGASRMRYRQFLVFNAAGCIVWASTFVAIGYFLGASWQVAAKWIGRASQIIGGAILLAIVMGWLWHWLVRHEADVMRRWQSAVEHPLVAALSRRFAPQLQFLRDRLSLEGYLGLQMTIGLLLFIGASWLFGGIAEDVVHGDPLTVIDKDIAIWLRERTTPGMLTLMQLITDLASPVCATVVSSLIVLVLCWKRYWYRLFAFILVFPGGMVMAFLLKIAFHRSRPSFLDSSAILGGYSFPSGHTMAAMLLYGILAVLGVIAIDSWRWRVGMVISACITVMLVGFSRMYLSAHYMSDVLAAIAIGFAWLALCLTAVNTLRRHRTHRDTRE